MRQYFCEFGIAPHVTKIFNSKICLLYKYFKAIPVSKPASGSSLSSPDGHLSLTAPSTSIVAANQEDVKVLATEKSDGGSKQRETYTKYTTKQKATIGNYSI